jgi:hypothetical protein
MTFFHMHMKQVFIYACLTVKRKDNRKKEIQISEEREGRKETKIYKGSKKEKKNETKKGRRV